VCEGDGSHPSSPFFFYMGILLYYDLFFDTLVIVGSVILISVNFLFVLLSIVSACDAGFLFCSVLAADFLVVTVRVTVPCFDDDKNRTICTK